MRRQDVTVRVSPNSLATAVPFCVMAVVACFDLVVGTRTQVGFMSLLSLGPALAPVSLGPVRTALTGGVAIMLSFLLAALSGFAFSTHAVESCATIAGVTVAAVIASAARQRKERELVDVRAVADVAQRVLLHRVPGEVGQLQIAVRYISAAAAARIGGDLYDVVAVAEPLEASLPLGLGHLDPGVRKEHTAPFGPADRILFYTDGISEARDLSGAFYQVERSGHLLDGPDPVLALDRLYDDVLRHVGGHLQDDSAALFIARRSA